MDVENNISNKGNAQSAAERTWSAVAAAGGGKQQQRKKKRNRKKKTANKNKPKLQPVSINLASVSEDYDNGLGFDDILVVPAPTPRDKLQNELNRLKIELDRLPKFTPEWFKAKADLAVIQIKLDEWDNATPTAASTAAANKTDSDAGGAVVTTQAAYQDFINYINNSGEEDASQTSSTTSTTTSSLRQKEVQHYKNNKKKNKNRPKLKPQSVLINQLEDSEGDEEEGLAASLGYNDILLTKKKQKSSSSSSGVMVDECTTLLVDQVVVDGGSKSSSNSASQDCQEVVCQSNDVGDWILRSVIGILFGVLVFKLLLP